MDLWQRAMAKKDVAANQIILCRNAGMVVIVELADFVKDADGTFEVNGQTTTFQPCYVNRWIK